MNTLRPLCLSVILALAAFSAAAEAGSGPIVPAINAPAPAAATPPTAAEMQAQIEAAQRTLAGANQQLKASKDAMAARGQIASAQPAAPVFASAVAAPTVAPVAPAQCQPCAATAQFSHAKTKHKKARPTEADIKALEDELATAKSKLKLAQVSEKATQKSDRAEHINAKVVFNYLDSAIYRIDTAIGHATNLQLQPGETLVGTDKPISGDTVRWEVATTKAGTAPNETTLVVVKPKEPGIETNMLITTNRHIYNVVVRAGDSEESPFMPIVAWNYPYDEAQAKAIVEEAKRRDDDSKEPLGVDPAKLAFGYTIKGDSYPWKPVRVFDDGSKTFIEMSPTMKSYDAPSLFVLDDDDNPLMVNFRVKGNYYIVDRLFQKAQLRVGPKQVVDVVHGAEQPTKTSWFN